MKWIFSQKTINQQKMKTFLKKFDWQYILIVWLIATTACVSVAWFNDQPMLLYFLETTVVILAFYILVVVAMYFEQRKIWKL